MRSSGDQKKRRAWATKTKSGCGTCRARRIKCDEARPACQRCSGSGRECPGYDMIIIAHKAPAKPPPPRSQVSTPRLKPGELKSTIIASNDTYGFDFYAHFLAPLMDVTLYCSTWSKTAMQMSIETPFILQFLVSLSSAYRARTTAITPDQHSMLDDKYHQLALSRHGSALKNMRRHLESVLAKGAADDDTVAKVALACLISTSLHLLLGLRRVAVSQFRSGRDVLRGHNSGRCLELQDLYRQLDGGTSYFEIQPLPPWSWVQFQFPLPDASSYQAGLGANVYSDFLITSLFQIRDQLLRRAHENSPTPSECTTRMSEWKIHGMCALSTLSFEDMPWIATDLQLLKVRVEHWLAAERVIAKRLSTPRRDSIRSFFRSIYTRQLLSVLQNLGEPMCYDEFEDDYRKMLDLASEYVGLGSASSSPSERPLVAGPEVLVAVYFAGLRCRDPAIRRRALVMLTEASQYSDWPGNRFLGLAIDKVIQFEEAEASRIVDQKEPVTKACNIPRAARLTDVRIVEDENDSQLAELLCGRLGPDGTVEIIRETLRSHAVIRSPLEDA